MTRITGPMAQEMLAPMHDDPILVVLVPLRDHQGRPRAFVLVDPDDAERVNRHRWHLRREEGYAATTIDGRHVALGRFILGNVPEGMVADHINQWPLDNRRANLRIVTHAENAQNQASRGGSSKHRGVTWDKSRELWMATAMKNGRRTTIGRFATEDEAANAVAVFRRAHMPFSTEARA